MKKNEPLQCARMILKMVAIGCFLICGSLFVKPANAAIEYETAYNLSPENITVMENNHSQWYFGLIDCDNSILIVDLTWYVSFTSDSVYWGSQAMTALGTYNTISNIRHLKYYLINPLPGYHYLDAYLPWGGEQWQVGKAIQFCGVDLDDPFGNNDQDYYIGSDASWNLLSEAEQGQVMLGYAARYKGPPAADVFSVDDPAVFLYNTKSDIGTIATAYIFATTTGLLYQSWHNADTAWGEGSGFLLLNPAINTSYSTSSINNITIPDFTCCENTDCLYPLSYDDALGETTIAWGVDLPNCNIFDAEAANILTLDLYAGQPVNIVASSTLSAGSHDLCFVWSNETTAEILTKSFSVMASTSNECIGIETPPEWCIREEICADTSSSTTIWTGLECAGKMTACWLFSPIPNSLDFISNRYNAIKTKAPFSLYFNLTDSLQAGFTKNDDRTGSIGLPMWSASSSSYYFITVLDASSTEKAIGKTNATLFRNTQKWIIWSIVALIILIFLNRKK